MGVGVSEVKGRTCMIKVEVEVTNEDGERRSCDKQMSRTHERLGPDGCISNLNETSLSPSRGARFSWSFVLGDIVLYSGPGFGSLSSPFSNYVWWMRKPSSKS